MSEPRSVMETIGAVYSIERLHQAIEKGFDLLARDEHGASVIHRAASYGRVEIIQELLRLGVTVDHMSRYGETALQYATEHGKVGAVICLLKNGANPNVTDEAGATPLSKAIYLKPIPIDVKIQLVKAFLQYGTDIHLKDIFNESACDHAIKSKTKEIITLMEQANLDKISGIKSDQNSLLSI